MTICWCTDRYFCSNPTSKYSCSRDFQKYEPVSSYDFCVPSTIVTITSWSALDRGHPRLLSFPHKLRIPELEVKTINIKTKDRALRNAVGTQTILHNMNDRMSQAYMRLNQPNQPKHEQPNLLFYLIVVRG